MPYIGFHNMSKFQHLNLPLMHGYPATLSVHAGDQPLPPPDIFNWHYLQCAVLHFGTPQYKNFFNINFCVHSFRTASDEADDESVDSFDETNPPYPSYHFLTDFYSDNRITFRLWNVMKKCFDGLLAFHPAMPMRSRERDRLG